MPKTVTIAGPYPGGAIANQSANFTITVANSDAKSAQLVALTVNEATESDTLIAQPVFAVAGQPPGSASYPTVAASGSLSFQFSAMFTSLRTPGISPNNPGGAAPGQSAYPPDSNYVLQATAQLSDGSVVFTNFTVPVLSAVSPFPVPQGGATQFAQGANSNLIAAFA